jgi:hypothetical protein
MRILRGLSSRLLPCGCAAGVYETYDGDVVNIVDQRDASCANSAHTYGNVLPDVLPRDASEHDANRRLEQ